ncbi:MAG: AmmeMemoRadiSam system protein B [Thermotogae bacterium]|nr:MAG: AmmeMemoRadiSam system protein B [Thermotogota bacterium]
MMRRPVVSGVFYPSDPDLLKSSLQSCFLGSFGPGHIPPVSEKKLSVPVAIVVPHAGYIYSGQIAAHAYAEAAAKGAPELVVLLGTNHTGFGASVGVWNNGSWRTPLGEVSVAEEEANLLLRDCNVVSADYDSHLSEHSIEVQIPFLQYVFETFKILPISLKPVPHEVSKELANALEMLLKRRPSTLVVVTTDLNHYENHNTTLKKDDSALKAILERRVADLYKTVVHEKITMCGVSPVATLLCMDFTTARLLSHKTSGDITGDRSKTVGYASLIFERSS